MSGSYRFAGHVRMDTPAPEVDDRAAVASLVSASLLVGLRRRRRVVGAGGSEAQQRLAELPDPPDDPSGAVSGPVEMLRRAVTLLRSEVEDRTWQAFWRAAVEGHAPADIAADLGLSVNAVYLAKARLLRRLRDEFGDLLS